MEQSQTQEPEQKQEENKETVQEAQVKQETEQKEQEQPKSEEAQPPKETDKKEIYSALEILEKEKNELLDREEITAIVRSTVTPNKDQVKKLLTSKLKADADLIVLRNIYSKFGEQEFKINAYVYTNKETLERLKTEKKVKVKPKEEKKEE